MDIAILVMAGAWGLGAFISGLTGMGGALISLPIISLVLASKSVIVISLLTGAVISLMSFILYHRYIDVREVLGFWIAALPGLLLGSWTLKVVDIEILQMLLAILLAINIIVQLIQDWLGTCMAPRVLMKYLCGFFAGFFIGSLGIGGPIMAIYASLMCMEKNTARGFFASIIPMSIINLSVAAWNDLITAEVLDAVIWVLPAAVTGFFCAWPLARRIRQELFHIALLILQGVASISLFLKALPYFL
jgi:uncharacterized membrane protein YfcA